MDLNQLMEFQRVIIDNSAMWLNTLDAQGRVTHWNRAAEEISGYPREEILGRTDIWNLLYPDDSYRDYVFAKALEIIERDLKLENFETTITCKDGSRKILSWNSHNLTNSQGEVIGSLALARDVTEAHETQRRLEQALEDARSANFAKTRFLASASHDLRQPLQAMSLFSAVLKKRVTDQALTEIIGLMEKSMDALRELLDTLLDICKLEAGVITANKSSVSIEEIADRVVNELQLPIETKGLRLQVYHRFQTVDTDPALLMMILRNLLGNALRHTQSGSILLTARNRGDHVLIQVIDTGCGIAEHEQEKIFEEFYQVSNPNRDRRHGLGLGLAIVSRTASLLGTRVNVRSRLGHGSVFEFLLPAGSQRKASSVDEMPLARNVLGATVLVIDDEPDILRATCLLLQAMSHQTIAALSIDDAMQQLAAGVRPDLIIADYRLGNHYTGAEAITRIRNHLGDVTLPALIITGDTAPDRLVDTDSTGLIVLHKPVKPDEMSSAIGCLLSAGSVQ